jgi:UV DNA damage endonuclease
MLRLGLCCQFAEQPIKFRTTTATNLLRLSAGERQYKLSRLCLANAESLLSALQYCADNGIGCFRIGSSILPIKTHPQVGYSVGELPESDMIVGAFRCCGEFASQHGVRTVFHPDQFVVLNSPLEDVVEKSIEELEYQAGVAEWVGADVINIHGGGAYGDKTAALTRFARNVDRLPDAVRSRLTIENDDKVYAPKDLLPLCRATGLPLVYDVHHHRCLSDGLTIEQATDAALCTWAPRATLSYLQPAGGWNGPKPQRHHIMSTSVIFQTARRQRRITVEVEAKAKEPAARLADELHSHCASSPPLPEQEPADESPAETAHPRATRWESSVHRAVAATGWSPRSSCRIRGTRCSSSSPMHRICNP